MAITNYEVISDPSRMRQLENAKKQDLSPVTADTTVWLDNKTSLHDKLNDPGGGIVCLRNGQIPAEYLPSYVDDVVEGYYNAADGLFYTSYDAATKTYSGRLADSNGKDTGKGEAGKIYVDKTPSADAGYLVGRGQTPDPAKDNQDDIYRCTSEGTFVRISDTTARTLREVADLRGAVGTLTASVSPGVVFTGVDVNATVKAATNIPADTLQVTGSALGTTTAKTGVTSVTETYSLAAGDNTTPRALAFTAISGIGTTETRKTAYLYIVNPVYVGAGQSASEVMVDANKQTARTTPGGTYTVTASEGDYVWIIVPAGTNGMVVGKATLSGFDFPLEAADTASVEGYRVYRSRNTYKAGTLTISVSGSRA